MSTDIQQLPAVASKFYTYCKKCDTDRYHTVLTHTSEKAAKIKCEVCASVKSYTLPKTQSRKTGEGVVRKLSGAAAAKRVQSENAKKSAHQTEYSQLMSNEKAHVSTYNMKSKFELNHKLDHPKFGMGYIKDVKDDKIEVVFSDEVRQLIHNRQ